MTRMIPNTVHSSNKSAAEHKIFEWFRDAPGTDAWTCLHSLGIAQHPYKRRAEIDFLLLTPEGAFVLEVKGGRVQRKDGVWLFTDRHGKTASRSEGPIRQAESAMFSLERSLHKAFPDEPRLQALLLGFGIMFPDVPYASIGMELDRAQVFDANHGKHRVVEYVRELIRYTRAVQPRSRFGLKKEDMEKLVQFLQGDFDLVPTFAARLDDTNAALTKLTEEQYHVLDCSEAEDRLLVQGAAGTGKSLLALEVARRESRAGKKALLLTYNSALAAFLAAQLEGEPGVTARSFHSCLREVLLESVGNAQLSALEEGHTPNDFFQKVLPEHAAYALLEHDSPPFDVLIVDEAQDILSERNGEALSLLITSGLSGGRWRMFLDPNDQAAIYGNLDATAYQHLRRSAATVQLTRNCRNTVEISQATRLLAAPKSFAVSVERGPAVERRWYQAESGFLTELTRTLVELGKEQVGPERITVLLPRKPDESRTRSLRAAGLRPFTAPSSSQSGPMYAVSSGYKGLENDVIIFAGPEDLDSSWARAVAYVSMSRARAKLYVLLPESVRATVDRRFADIVLRKAAQ